MRQTTSIAGGSREDAAAAVRDAIDDVRARWERLLWLQLLARATIGVATVWLAAWWIVRASALGGAALVFTALAALGAGVAAVIALALRPRRLPGDRALARYIEEQHPALEDRLVTAVQVAGDDHADASIRGALLTDTAGALDRVPLDDIVPRERLRRASVLAATGAAGVLVALLLWIEPGRQALRVAALYAVPGRLALHVAPGDVRLKRGDPLVISATTTSGRAGILPELTVRIGDERRTVRMPATGGDRFSWRFDAVPASFTYSVSAAGRTSETYSVTALDAPRVARIDLRYEYPEYTRLPPREEQDGGDIFAPTGTRVTLSIQAREGPTAGALALAGGTRVPLRPLSAGRFQAALPVTADGSYRVALTDGDGLTSNGDTEYFIHVLNDRPPDVRILRPAGDRQVTRLEEVTIEARADDDYGVGSFDLVYSVRGGTEKAVPLSGERSPLSVTGRHTLYLEDLDVKPGDFVTYYARVRDVARGRRSAEARSDIFFLEVKPFEEEFAAAQSQAGAGSGNRSLDDLVTAQKDIVVATWKLDRRRAAGRSVDDVKAVGRAQGELKQRVEHVAAQSRDVRRRPRAVQGDTIGAPPDDPMTSAAAAMGRAKTALDAVKTGEALPAEMEALNHLLRAQAEVKRREVMRQQASAGMGGSNRAQQDLSTLFDRELQRQQQTNYETQQSTEERQDGAKDGGLDRIRELARRQEQLARQQEALAKERDRLSAEEMRRRLERLTREQSELRQQAEELARQMGQEQTRQQAQQGQQGQRGSERGQAEAEASGATRAQLRDASEEMRGAASDLRRQDPRQASARSARALDRLRALERQLQASQPDERRRALGDLQLEARQLAERQRQLGEQTSSAARGPQAADARRRIAGDQDRLADRLKRLQEQVSGLAATSPASESQQAVGEAARQLEQERIEARMREAARALRSAGTERTDGERMAAQVAGTARDLARAMDRVADRLGEAPGAPNADDRKLSDQLARTREVREEMNDLQRRMQQLARQAEASAEAEQQRGGENRGQPTGASRAYAAVASAASSNKMAASAHQGSGYAKYTSGLRRCERSEVRVHRLFVFVRRTVGRARLQSLARSALEQRLRQRGFEPFETERDVLVQALPAREVLLEGFGARR